MGISIPKYNIPLYGQKARAKRTPSSKTSQYEFTPFDWDLLVNWLNPGKGILRRPSMIKPMMINRGPIIFSPYSWNHPDILNWSAPMNIITARMVYDNALPSV